MFHNRNDVAESKMGREMRCFTIETGVGGPEGRRCQMAVSIMFAYARLWSPMLGCVRDSPRCNGGSQVCAVLLGNAIADC